MKEPFLIEAMERVVVLEMKVLDKLIKELIEPIADVGNPEKLIGKPYESWTPQDKKLLTTIYGTKEPNRLSDFIFKKEYQKVKDLEGVVE